MSSDPLQKDIEAVLGPASPQPASGAGFNDRFGQLDDQFSSRFGRPLFVTAGDNAEHRKLHPGGAADIRAKDLSDDERKFVVSTARGLGMNVRDYSWVKQPYITPTGITISGPHIHLDADQRQQAGSNNLNDDVQSVLRPSTPKAAMPDRSFNSDVQSVTAVPSTTSPTPASGDHSLFSAALNEVMQLTGVGEAKAREFLASKSGKKSYPGLPVTPATPPTAAISPGGVIPAVQPADGSPAPSVARTPALTTEDLMPAIAPLPDKGPAGERVTPTAPVRKASVAQPQQPASGPPPEALAVTNAELAQINTRIDSLLKAQDHLKAAGVTDSKELQPLTDKMFELLRRRQQIESGAVMSSGTLARMGPEAVQQAARSNQIRQAHAANIEAMKQADEATAPGAIIADAGSRTFDQAMRPFAVASTAIAGVQRAVGAAIANPKRLFGDSPYNLKSFWNAVAHKAATGEDTPGYEQPVAKLYELVHEHYGGDPNDAAFQLAHSAITGVTDPVMYGAVDLVAGEGTGAIKNLRKPVAALAEETAARDLAGAVKVKTTSRPPAASPEVASPDLHSDVEAVLGPASPEKASVAATRGTGSKQTFASETGPVSHEELSDTLDDILSLIGDKAARTRIINDSIKESGPNATYQDVVRLAFKKAADHPPIPTKEVTPGGNSNPAIEHLRSEGAASAQEGQQQAATAPVKQEEVGKARAQESVRPRDTLTRPDQSAPAPLSRDERANLTSDKLQAAIENAPDNTRQSLESLQRVGKMIDGAVARKADIENIANLELRQVELLGKSDVREALGLEPIKGEKATDRLPPEPEPRNPTGKAANPTNKTESPTGKVEAPAPLAAAGEARSATNSNISEPTRIKASGDEVASPATTSDASRLQGEFDSARLKLDDLNQRRRNGESISRLEIATQEKATSKAANKLKLAKIAESKISAIQQQRVARADSLPDRSSPEVASSTTSPQPARLADAKGSPESPARVVTVNDKQITLSEEQSAKWDEAQQRYNNKIAHAKSIEEVSKDPERAGKIRKQAGMEFAADKRQITGELTGKERGAIAKREQGNYIGKAVEVEIEGKTVKGEIKGNPFGRVTVKLKDGRTVTVARDQVTPSVGIDVAAREAATSPTNALPEPTEPQIEAGNYTKGHARIAGMDISIENPAGSKRRPEWPDLKSHYGYIRRTTGADAEQLDVFVKPGTPKDYDGPVFVVDQLGKDGKFDEHKVMLGFPDEAAARAGYSANYTPDWKVGPVREFKSVGEFRDWMKTGDTTKPAASPEAAVSSKPAQLDAIKYAASQHGINHETEIMDRFGVKPEQLGKKDASALLDWLNGKGPEAGPGRLAEAKVSEPERRAALINSIKSKLGKVITEERGSFSNHKLTPEEIKNNAILPDLIEMGKSYIREAKGKSGFEVFQRFRRDIEEVFADRMDAIKPHLMGVWQAAKDSTEAERQQAKPATQPKLIETTPQAEPVVPKLNLTEEQRAQNAEAFDEAMKQKKPVGSLRQNAVDLLNAPRAIMASADLSAPLRQGAILTLTEPKAGIAAARDMLRAISEKGFENVKAELANHPRAELAEQSGLYQATKAHSQSPVALSLREEAFMSRLMGKLPIVKQSEQAYVAYLDRLRMDTFSKYADQLEKSGLTPAKNPKEFEDIAHFINLATGRGDLPKVLDSLAPVLNGVFFSPRYAMSRIQVLNPRTYWKMSPAARAIAMKKMAEFTGAVATTLGLAKLAGADVSLDPDSADFLKVKVGNTRYDVLAGFQQYMRFAFQMTKGFYNNATGKKNERNHEPLDVATKFVRSKLAPVASFVTDAAAGKDFKGERFSLGKGITERLAPMVVNDAYEAWKQDGAAGTAKTAPGFFGVGVQTYKNKPKPLTLDDIFK